MLFELIDGNKKPVTKFPGTSLLWNIYPVSDGTIKGNPRAVFSFRLHDSGDADSVLSLLRRMNEGDDVSRLESFCVGKVERVADWQRLSRHSNNRFEVVYANQILSRQGIDRAQYLKTCRLSEVWQIVVANDFTGSRRAVFSFVVGDEGRARVVLTTVNILNRVGRPNITQCPFFCMGKVTTSKDMSRFGGWMNTHSELYLPLMLGQHKEG